MEQYENNYLNDRYKFIYKETINNKYILTKQIGFGSYSNVFSCVLKDNLVNKYAMKILRNNKLIKTSGENELTLLKKLKHPNIMKIHENFTYKNFLIIVMPHNKNLYNFCKSQLYINHYDTCTILMKIASGLDYLKKIV